MKLYRLYQRWGRRRRRLYPWFEPPPPDFPMKYDGWVWNPATKEWDEAPVEEISVEVEAPRYPKPTKTPRPAQSLTATGWYWNGRAGVWEEVTMPYEDVLVTPERPPAPSWVPKHPGRFEVPGWKWYERKAEWGTIPMKQITEYREMERPPKPEYIPGVEVPTEYPGWSWSGRPKEWVATIIMAEKIGFTPPRSLPPQVSDETILAAMPLEEMYVRYYEKMIALGMQPHEARKMQQIAGEYMVALMKAKRPALAAKPWHGVSREVAAQQKIMFQQFTVDALMILVAVVIGVLIGTILERLTFPEDPMRPFAVPPGTYLLGPGGWRYSRHVGCSLKGRPFYSECEGIGTGWVRHKRAGIGEKYDTIDFPGGFVEEGYDFPYFVKYTWSYWLIQYVGMLYSVGPALYALKKADDDWYAGLPPGVTVKYEHWCKDFHFYL